jgi:uncharacterized protein (DUF4213/DUF364 family)
MKVLEQLVDSLTTDQPVTAAVIGSHLIAVMSRRLGLASNLHSPGCQGPDVLPDTVGSLVGKNGRELARQVLLDEWLQAGIGMAALNSLLDLDYESLVEINAKQIIADRANGKDLVVVGHFPFVEELRAKVRNLWIMEKEPRAGDLSEEEGYQALARADVVAVTGTSLINHTFDRILASCQPGSFKIMLGPSTPLSPILLEFGLDVIGGALVEDEATVLTMVEKGVVFRRLKGIRTVVMAKDPRAAWGKAHSVSEIRHY